MAVLAIVFLFTALLQEESPNPSIIPAKQTSAAPALPVAVASKILNIPHLDRAPKLEEFMNMAEPSRPDLLKVTGFVERDPKDGDEPTQRTDVYIGYDNQNLYVVWLCFDKEPGKIRAHMSRRENIYDDDYVELMLDTFHDQRHALVFDTNPFGIQADGLYTENGSGTDNSWDTVWNTAGRITHDGYVVIQSIPFHCLRFRGGATVPDWGLVLMRVIPRSDESDFFPRVSSKLNGQLNQEATVTGFEGISPGRNMQFNPYIFGRSFRSINQDVPTNPALDSKTLDSKGGLDAKFVFKDPDKLAAYAKLAGPAFSKYGARYIARDTAANAYEAGIKQRIVIVEFESVEQAIAAYESELYKPALKVLGDAAQRDFRIIEGR